MVEWYCLLQVPSVALLWLGGMEGPACRPPSVGVSPSCWPFCQLGAGGLPAWGVEVWWVLVAILVVMGVVSWSIKEKGCPLTRTAIRLVC